MQEVNYYWLILFVCSCKVFTRGILFFLFTMVKVRQVLIKNYGNSEFGIETIKKKKSQDKCLLL